MIIVFMIEVCNCNVYEFTLTISTSTLPGSPGHYYIVSFEGLYKSLEVDKIPFILIRIRSNK